MNRERHILYTTLLLALAMAVLQYAAITHSFYWTYWWYDVMMHSLTGFIVGFFAYWFLFASGHAFKAGKSRAFMLVWIVSIAFAIGFAWEFLEYANGITDSHEGYLQDTVNDLILDSCGAALAVLAATKRKKNG
jgi:hypothetical protein